MRLRIALGLAVAVWALWGLFIYRPAPNALPACSPEGPLACSTVDGFPIGDLIRDCGGQPDVCGDNERLALAALDARNSGHQAVGQVSLYALDMARVCGPNLCALSESYTIFVFQLTDRSLHAIAVSCGVEGCRAEPDYSLGHGA